MYKKGQLHEAGRSWAKGRARVGECRSRTSVCKETSGFNDVEGERYGTKYPHSLLQKAQWTIKVRRG